MDFVLFALAVLLAQAVIASQWSDALCGGALAVVAAIAVVRTARANRAERDRCSAQAALSEGQATAEQSTLGARCASREHTAQREHTGETSCARRRWRTLFAAAMLAAAAGALAHPPQPPSRTAWGLPWNAEGSPPLRIESLLDGQLSTDAGFNIRGSVIDVAPSSSGGVRLAVAVEDVARDREAPRAATGVVALSIRYGQTRWRTGDRVGFRSRLRRLTSYGNFGEFDWATYNARRGIFVSAYAWRESDVERLDAQRGVVDRVRLALSLACDQVGGQGAAILEALTSGDRVRLSDATALALRDAGLSHFLAISGSHMVLVAALAVGLLRWALGLSATLLASYDVTRPAAVGGAIAVVAYAAITGGGVSVARSVLMALASLVALWRGRPGDDLRALSGSAVVLAIALPGVGEEAGFQLSFAAVAVLIAYGRHRRQVAAASVGGGSLTQRRPRRYLTLILEAVKLTVVCCLVTSPIVAQHFHRVSSVAPLSNLFAAPLVSAIVVVGLAALVAAPVWPAGQHWLVLVGAKLGDALVFVATTAASLPYASVATPAPGVVLTVALAAVPFVLLLSAGVRRVAALSGLGAVVAGCVAIGYHDRFRDDRLDAWFPSVGQGDAAVLRLPGGEVVVIDGGPEGRGRMVMEPLLRRLWIGRIDVLVASHLQFDHCGAFPELLDAFEVGQVWVPAGSCEGPVASAVLGRARGHGVEVRHLRTGDGEASPREFVAGTTPHALAASDALVANDALAASDALAVSDTLAAGEAAAAESSSPRLFSNTAHNHATPRATLEILNPPDNSGSCDGNDQSLVLAVSFAGRRLLFTGDIEAPAEQALVQAGAPLRSDLLKVAHHGSRTSSTAQFLDAVAPSLAVVSLGLENHYGFPDREVEARYRARDLRWLRTDQVGAVHVVVDAQGLTVLTARASAQP